MGTIATSTYEHAVIQDYMDQHLDMETAILRVELEEAEVLRKVIHHLKLNMNQMASMLNKLPESVTQPDGTIASLVSSDDAETLRKTVKQLNILELPDITPELERDIFIYNVAHNYVNAFAKWRNVALDSLFGQVFSVEGVKAARASAPLYWRYNRSEHVTDLIGEHGYSWTFIDPNNEVDKLREKENLSAPQARAKIMQRFIDLVSDQAIAPHSRWENSPAPFVRLLWVMIDRGSKGDLTEWPEGDDFYKLVAKADPSRYLIETEEEDA